MSAKILLLQQNDSLRRAKSLVFGGAYFHSLALKDLDDVNDYLSRERVDVILTDCRGAENRGLDLVETLRKEQPKAKVVLVANAMDLPQVIRSIRLGIKDVFQGPIDLRAMAKCVGDLAGKDAAGEALRKADWTSLGDFFSAEGTMPGSPDLAPKAAPPTPGRRAKSSVGKEDTEDLSKERQALAAERLRLTEEGQRLKEQLEEIERRRSEVNKAEARAKEGSPTGKPNGSTEETLRREREQLRMHVVEVESEMELLRADLAKKEKALADAEAALIQARMGKPAPPAPDMPAVPISNPLVEAALKQECEDLRAGMAQLETERDRAREQVKAKEKALLSATETVQRLQTEAARLEEQLKAKESAGTKTLATDEQARREREQLVLALAKLESERDFAREQLASNEVALSAANEAVHRLQVEAAKLTQQRAAEPKATDVGLDESTRRETEQLRTRVVKLESERDLAREQLASKEKMLTEANLTVQRLRLEVVQFDQKLRAQESSGIRQAGTAAVEAALRADLAQAQAQLAELETERTFAREQVAVKEEALALANQTVESLREEVADYANRLRASESTRMPFPVANDDGLKAERDQLRVRLTKVERERDQAREQLLAKERALNEAQESLRRIRTEQELSQARNTGEDSRREAELAAAQKRLAKAQAELETAQEKLEESWETLRQTQEASDRRKRQIDEQAVALAHRERLLATERSAKIDTAGAEEIGAAERRLRLLRTELSSLAAALNEREAGLRAQESRIETLLQKADGDLRNVAVQERHLQLRAEDIQKRIEAAEKQAAEIVAAAQARADAEERARAGMNEALQLERQSVRKAEARYLAACHQVGEQLQALADREAQMRKREFHLDEREAAIRQILNRVMADASAIGRGEMDVKAPDCMPPAQTVSDCDDTRQQLEESKRRFADKMARLSQLKEEIG